MAYRISGTASEDCTVYVINTASNLVDKVESVSAGAYEITLLTSQNNHLFAEPVDTSKTPIVYTNVDAEYYDYIQPTFGLNLKESKRHVDYSAGVTFSAEAGPSLRGYNANTALGWATAFCVFDKNVLIGNKVQIDWSGNSGSGDEGTYRATIADGSYDRTNDSDFPVGQDPAWVSKGAGDLVSMYNAQVSSFGRNTLDSGILTLASSTQSYVTVFVSVRTNYGQFAWYDLFGMTVKSSSDAVVTDATINGSLVWTEGGVTHWKYGKLGTPVTVIAQ